ncbi:unnamed protein product, partial [Hapterophycus canaliculatus]
MERVGSTHKQRRIIASPTAGEGGSDAAAAAGGELPAPASTAIGGERTALLASRSSSSCYSAAASATPVRHRRDNPAPARVPASAAGAGATAAAAAAAAAAAVHGRLSPPISPTFRPDSPGRDESRYHHVAGDNKGSSTNGDRGFRPGSASWAAAFRRELDLLERRFRRLLWYSRWRGAAGRLRVRLENRLSRLLRYRWGRRLVVAAAVLLVALASFLAITAVAGPAVGGVGVGGSGTAGGANGGGGGGEKDGTGHRTPSYYRKIAGQVGVGPSMSDPWVVRDIEIAAADWGLAGVPALEKSGSGESGGNGAAKRVVLVGDGVEGPLAVGAAASGAEREKWDGRVNTIVTGDLQPVGGAKTRPKVDLLLVIFSGTSEPNIEKRELLRQIYDKYEGWVKVGGPDSITGGVNPERRDFTFSVVFVMSKETAPPEGELVGDILYVPVPEGYRNIVLKTRAMLCLVSH